MSEEKKKPLPPIRRNTELPLYYSKLWCSKNNADLRSSTGLAKLPLKPPPDDEVLVKVIWAGVNATDVVMAAGKWPFFEDRHEPDLGIEAHGLVVLVGKNVTDMIPDTPVLWCGVYPKSYSEYFYAKPAELIPVPAVRKEFIAFPISGLTAYIGLDEAAKIKKGDKVLITAAAGGTGHLAVQYAKMKECHVIGLTSTEQKAEFLKELGTDRVINYKTDDLDAILKSEYPEGIDVIWETIGGEIFKTLFDHLAPKGRMVIVGTISGYKERGFNMDIDVPDLPGRLLAKNQTLVGFGVFDFEDLFLRYMKELLQDLIGRRIRVVIDMGEKSYDGAFTSLSSVTRAVEHLHEGRNIGKVAIRVGTVNEEPVEYLE